METSQNKIRFLPVLGTETGFRKAAAERKEKKKKVLCEAGGSWTNRNVIGTVRYESLGRGMSRLYIA